MMMTSILLLFLSSGPAQAQSRTELFAKSLEYTQKGKSEDALSYLRKMQKKDDLKPEDKLLIDFNVAYLQFQQGKYQDAVQLFQEFTKQKSELVEYAHFYLGSSYMKLGKNDEAIKEFEKVLSHNPNLKLRIESANLLGQMAIQAKNFKLAKTHIYKLEKRTRGSEQYPEIIYNMALIERGLNNHRGVCNWVTKLYSRYPSYGKIKDWSADLATNELDGKPSDCNASPEEFRSRIRNMMFSGLDQKAQAEINIVKERLSKTDLFLADQLQAQFFLQEGEVVKAVELLKPHYETMKRNFSYLMLFGSASARAGEVQQAVGSYYSAYKLSPRSNLGRQALYQSAFLSYQFQDYDGAARRFKEFIKTYPTSGLNKDAKWHLAWLSYLKGNYDGAFKDFENLLAQKKKQPRAWKAFPADRTTYWMAMSRYRQGQYDQAEKLFQPLAKDKLVGYYAIASQSRLKKIALLRSQDAKLAQQAPKVEFVAPRAPSRFSASDFLMPSFYEDGNYDSSIAEASESEETLIANQYEEVNTEENDEVAGTIDNPDLKSVEVAADGQSPFAAPNLARKFEQARELISVGLNDWARWDLYEIESKTSNREYLRTLMNEYTKISHYHRASYIAQIQFGSQRANGGMEGARATWEYAYPKAYETHVANFSKSFSVPQELVWGIMRAESQYRRDAISPVGALGLMQVMPFTGHKVAMLLGDKNFAASKLLEPETAIKMGSRYLKRLMDTFDNTIPFVAAGYNAGPHRVKTWVANFGNLDTDEFIEHIPFLETRNYVKKVMSNCQIYSDLYNGKKELFPYLAEAVPVKFTKTVVAKENWDDI